MENGTRSLATLVRHRARPGSTAVGREHLRRFATIRAGTTISAITAVSKACDARSNFPLLRALKPELRQSLRQAAARSRAIFCHNGTAPGMALDALSEVT